MTLDYFNFIPFVHMDVRPEYAGPDWTVRPTSTGDPFPVPGNPWPNTPLTPFFVDPPPQLTLDEIETAERILRKARRAIGEE